MTLTTGATLQDGKYVIQGILSQNPLGVTYRATHLHLNQSVIIQTLTAVSVSNVSVADKRGSAAATDTISTRIELFLAEVRRRVKLQQPDTPPILDCFLEAGLPFVVMLLPKGVEIPAIADWLPQSVATEISTDDSSEPEAAFEVVNNPFTLPAAAVLHPLDLEEERKENTPLGVEAGRFDISSPEAVEPDDTLNAPPALGETSPAEVAKLDATPVPAANEIIPPQSTAGVVDALTDSFTCRNSSSETSDVIGAPTNTPSEATTTWQPRSRAAQADSQPTGVPSNGSAVAVAAKSTAVRSVSAPARRSKKRWLPLALAFTSVFAGLGGAGLGWAIRTERMKPPGSESGGILDPLVDNEQTFPPLEGWTADDPPLSEPAPPEVSPYRESQETLDRSDRPSEIEPPIYSDTPVHRRAAQPTLPREFIPPNDTETAPEPESVPPVPAPAAEAPVQDWAPAPEPPAKLKPEPPAAPPPIVEEAPVAPPAEAPPPDNSSSEPAPTSP